MDTPTWKEEENSVRICWYTGAGSGLDPELRAAQPPPPSLEKQLAVGPIPSR
jgi:hypothetical protein